MSKNPDIAPVFLTANWRYLVMLNYQIEPAILLPLVPPGTELDMWNGRTYVSIVGFLFLHTRVLGVPIPFHMNFEEVNLRFYVRRLAADGWRRGVVFVKELVPRWAIATTARMVYGENYQALPMRHTISHNGHGEETVVYASYEWRHEGRWQSVGLSVSGESQPLGANSEAEFITEHYWGYAAQRDGRTREYQVEHPRWRVWAAASYHYDADVAGLYGPEFVPALQANPTSAFLADGSAVTVRRERPLPAGNHQTHL